MQTNEPERKKRRIIQPEAPFLRLKIQRLKDEDFCISIRGRDPIIKLKKEILRLIQTAPLGAAVEMINIRLIYKGKVLIDSNSIEFYKIKDEDTIQLVPIRRSRPPSVEPIVEQKSRDRRGIDTQTDEASSNEPSPWLNPGLYRRTVPITVLMISSSLVGNRGARPARPSRSPSRRSHHRRRRARRQFREARPMPNYGRRLRSFNPSSLDRFRDTLQDTYRFFQRNEWRRQRTEDISHLNILIRQATIHRRELLSQLARQRSEGLYQATEDDGVFSVVPRQYGVYDFRNNDIRNMERGWTSPTEDEQKQHTPEIE